MYYHWRKQRAADGECTEMTGFTRVCASEGGLPDAAAPYIPSVFVPSLTPEVLAKYGHFGVLNRPHSVVEFFRRGLADRVKEKYVLVAETDHILTKPMPNLATDATADSPPLAAAHGFGYMHASSGHNSVIQYCWPQGDFKSLQAVGPSPLIIEKELLRKVAPLWLNCSYILRGRPEPAHRIQDWVLEMWGYSIAAAKLRVLHDVLSHFQVEGGAGISVRRAMSRGVYIFHYTYGLEYTLAGRPQGPGTIGEWSLDKRHYGGAYPPRHMQPPPSGASDGTAWLLEAWNEASGNISTWPESLAMGTVGWRRHSLATSRLHLSHVLATSWPHLGDSSATSWLSPSRRHLGGISAASRPRRHPVSSPRAASSQACQGAGNRRLSPRQPRERHRVELGEHPRLGLPPGRRAYYIGGAGRRAVQKEK